MKWMNKGHEFDSKFEKLFKGKKLYIYGAGNNGKRLYNKMIYIRDRIKGFIDRNKKAVDFADVITYEEINDRITDDDIVIISTDGQIATHMWLQLIALGFSENNIFHFREWEQYYLYIYAFLEKNIVISPFISLQFSNICNCKCKHCLAFSPEIKSPKYFGIEVFQKNTDAIFRNIDYVEMIDISGGEPFLIEGLAECIKYIGSKYNDRIGMLRTITNATIIPSDKICKAIRENNVWVWIDDYREANIGKNIVIKEIILKFDKYGIEYGIRKVDQWIDLGVYEKEKSSDIEAKFKFDECSNRLAAIYNQRLYNCCYACFADATRAYCGDESDYIDMRSERRIDKGIMLEFLLGYTEKGFLKMCRNCYGAETINNHYVPVAQQIRNKK